jgi:hypothetical protein
MMSVAAAQAADLLKRRAPPASDWDILTGARIWYASASFDYTLKDKAGAVSRLVFDGVTSVSGEAYGRLTHKPSGVFVKGFAGMGTNRSGTLDDSDFMTGPEFAAWSGLPPGVAGLFPPAGRVKVSDTTSDLGSRSFSYGALDVGIQTPPLTAAWVRFGVFAGLFLINDDFLARGLRENANYLTPYGIGYEPGTITFDGQTNAIRNDILWTAVRLGVEAIVPLGDKWSVRGEAAWLPWGTFRLNDSHFLRDDQGPLPNFIDRGGSVTGAQFESEITYAISPSWQVGAGLRYWWLQVSGAAAYAGRSPGSLQSDSTQTRFGAFANAAYRF